MFDMSWAGLEPAALAPAAVAAAPLDPAGAAEHAATATLATRVTARTALRPTEVFAWTMIRSSRSEGRPWYRCFTSRCGSMFHNRL